MTQKSGINFKALRALVLLASAALAGVAAPGVARAQTATPTPPWTQTGNNISNTNTGNVGVGTTAPNYKFEVFGAPSRNTLGLTGDGDSVGYAGIRLNALTTTNIPNNRTSAFVLSMRKDTWYGGDGSGPSFIVETATKGGGFAAPFLITPTNDIILNSGRGAGGPAGYVPPYGNVGIGTHTPNQKLSVVGTGAFFNSAPVQPSGVRGLFMGNFSVGSTIWSYNYVAGVGDPLFVSAQDITLNTYVSGNGVPRLHISNAGDVGIGIATPAHKLDVAGNVNAAGLCINGSCKSAWTDVGGGQWANSGANISSTNAGNVGVGVASPAAKLHVGGGGRLDGAGRIYLGTGAVQGARGLEFVEENATTFSIRHHDPMVAWRNIAINPYGGSVGVGTLSPRGKFEVDGGAFFLGDMGNAQWGNMVVRGRVLSASSNVHISPPGGMGVYIDSNFREAGGAAGPVNLHVSGDVIAGGNISAKYQDVAEWVPSVQKLSAGTVVVLDSVRTNHVLASASAYDTKVAGVVSAEPGVILGVAGEGKLKVATTGRVKVRVDATRAPVRIGDLLVTSEVEGVAMRSVPVTLGGRQMHAPGTIIGKALEPLEKGVGEILVLLSLQ